MTTAQTVSASSDTVGQPAGGFGADIYFTCPSCQGELVVDREGAGLTLPCSYCGHSVTIPVPGTDMQPTVQEEPIADATLHATATPSHQFQFGDKTREALDQRFSDLKHQLKENRSQDTEMRGHVNRATMELHRLQLKLKKLEERHLDINAEISALADWLDQGV